MAAVRAKQTFICYVDGVRTVAAEGSMFDAGDKIVKEHPEHFDVPEAAVRKAPEPASRPTAKTTVAKKV
jgi:hypothetical protein